MIPSEAMSGIKFSRFISIFLRIINRDHQNKIHLQPSKVFLSLGISNQSRLNYLLRLRILSVSAFSYLQRAICSSVNTLLQGTQAFHRHIMLPSSTTICILTLLQILQTHKIPHTLKLRIHWNLIQSCRQHTLCLRCRCALDTNFRILL